MLRKYIIYGFMACMSLGACQDLDISNPSTISSNDVWSDPELIQLYVN